MVGEDSPQDRRPPTEVPLALLRAWAPVFIVVISLHSGSVGSRVPW